MASPHFFFWFVWRAAGKISICTPPHPVESRATTVPPLLFSHFKHRLSCVLSGLCWSWVGAQGEPSWGEEHEDALWGLKPSSARLNEEVLHSYSNILTNHAEFLFAIDYLLCSINTFLSTPKGWLSKHSAPRNWHAVRPSVCPGRIGFRSTSTVWLNLAFYESPWPGVGFRRKKIQNISNLNFWRIFKLLNRLVFKLKWPLRPLL